MLAYSCPCCGSQDIDSARRECRACGVGLPDGSFEAYAPIRNKNRTKRSTGIRRTTNKSQRAARLIANG